MIPGSIGAPACGVRGPAEKGFRRGRKWHTGIVEDMVLKPHYPNPSISQRACSSLRR